ncbi:beta-ketoacyl-ACP synthase III [Clostridium sp. MD294]|uniref:beta-ketoacyl-ACP synthase III n=1 Tax=Clostridium sp. MD294 TaxID=97138 RepID=UPI0002CAA8A1|nr:beta-ketoacyl-ACP synthase III [Clostridium sp. MD294]NDO45703.1 ketoacyl-ACP synthase III [Clostridium sp. MD294]USF30644.1 3-oxoacyl-[acyl-carrier-protein] synthase 3 [Clostridium sp. MD294]
MIFSKIKCTGSYVPEKIVTNDMLSQYVDTSDEWIRSRSGIEKRHFSEGENTSDIAAKAALNILKDGNINALDIELIIVATVSPDYTTPSTACLVQSKIGAVNAVAFDLSAACSGFIFGVSTADKFIKNGVYKNALVIGAEVLSKHLNFKDRSTCVLFGDGAGGVFLEKAEHGGILAEEIGSDGNRGMSLTCAEKKASHIFNTELVEEDNFLHMDGRAIFDFATRQTPKCILRLIEKSGICAEQLKYVIPHQANARIVEIISRKTKIPLQKFYMNIAEYSNTSAATIPIALDQMMKKGLLQQGDYILMAGFGGGLTWGGLLIKM